MVSNLRTTVPEGASVRTRKVPLGHLNITATTSGSPDTFFTVGDDRPLEVKQLVIANLTGSAVDVSLHTHPSGDSAVNGNAEFLDLSIPANEVVDVTTSIQGYYAGGTVFSVYTDTTTAVNIHGFGEENL